MIGLEIITEKSKHIYICMCVCVCERERESEPSNNAGQNSKIKRHCIFCNNMTNFKHLRLALTNGKMHAGRH